MIDEPTLASIQAKGVPANGLLSVTVKQTGDVDLADIWLRAESRDDDGQKVLVSYTPSGWNRNDGQAFLPVAHNAAVICVWAYNRQADSRPCSNTLIVPGDRDITALSA